MPARPSGLRCAQLSSRPSGRSWPEAPGVGNAPGAIATVRTPLGPHSTARLRVIASTADFAIADGTVKARPVIVEVERMLSTTPLCLPSIQRLPAASVPFGSNPDGLPIGVQVVGPPFREDLVLAAARVLMEERG